jgi:hypothetical protein
MDALPECALNGTSGIPAPIRRQLKTQLKAYPRAARIVSRSEPIVASTAEGS